MLRNSSATLPPAVSRRMEPALIVSHDTALMQSMPEAHRLLFLTKMGAVRKSRGTALLLTLFLGGVGAHRFYLGQVGWGILYAVFFWTLIPALVALVELFFIGARVDNYNDARADEIASELRLLRT